MKCLIYCTKAKQLLCVSNYCKTSPQKYIEAIITEDYAYFCDFHDFEKHMGNINEHDLCASFLFEREGER